MIYDRYSIRLYDESERLAAFLLSRLILEPKSQQFQRILRLSEIAVKRAERRYHKTNIVQNRV